MPTVLVVDDSPVDRRLVGGLLGKSPRLTIEYAADGAEALAQIQRKPPDIVVTDLMMPEMNGLELVAAVVSKHPLVPVILMTGKGSEEIAVQALKEGAASYVPKSMLGRMLLETVEDVLTLAREERTHIRLMDCLIRNDCAFVVENDDAIIPTLISYLRRSLRSVKLCDEANEVRVCVALEEALRNALHHGNLELNSELREEDVGAYRALVEQRRRAAPFRDRNVYVEAKVARAEACFVVRDEGPGFDRSKLPDPRDPANLEKVSGRGLLLMQTFMDAVYFNDVGNEVTMVKRRPAAKQASAVEAN